MGVSAFDWKQARLLAGFALVGFMLAGLATIALSGSAVTPPRGNLATSQMSQAVRQLRCS